MKAEIPGDYDRLFIWLQESTTTETTIGAVKETWASNGQLWGQFMPLRANEMLMYAVKESLVDAKIRIRNRPALKFTDRLQDKETNDIYFIDGIVNDKPGNQLIVTCHRLNEPN